MFAIRFIKAAPTSYILQFKKRPRSPRRFRSFVLLLRSDNQPSSYSPGKCRCSLRFQESTVDFPVRLYSRPAHLSRLRSQKTRFPLGL